ncbi:methyltransferase domain-containing protein [Micromonospora sagamiensis]|uniref:Tocopherol O-methyltransferase n=1 Tax=Micromonospora sagamiensis TaxID=47875 RepID=A0A562WCC8_9ACTN|nr:methyltransferase domain-containing protein [Micromonospora sagamiensis]TWJ27856.1 tocopherol O-methyltransferase [Micromonospora sagamiensis]BCL13254.1 delta(24)-sterol C-methyltransferase [Micromonospora sagamiensis]
MSTQTTDTGMSQEGSVEDLHRAVRDHYDKLVDLYEDLWGEHIHHGYWDLDAPNVSRDVAQRRTSQELMRFGGIPQGARVLDSGCGIGASAVMLAADLGCTVEGITLSHEQVKRATAKAAEAGVGDRTSFRVLDAMHTDYPDDTFDVVWSMESCELMPDKRAYLAENLRILKPGGRLVVATWTSRDDRLDPKEVKLLRRLYRDFAISHVLPLEHYARLCGELGYTDVRTADWTENVRATWALSADIVKPLMRDPSYVWKLVRAKGADIFRFLNSVPLMKQAYDKDVMHYGVYTAVKPG